MLSQDSLLKTSFIFLTLSWLIPNHYLPWTSFYNEACAFLFLLSASSLLIFKNKIEIPHIALLVIPIAAIPLIQLYFEVILFSGDAYMASIYIIATPIAITLSFNIKREHGPGYANNYLAYGLIFGSIISTGIALNQWLELGQSIYIADMPPNGRPFANLAQPNNLATLLILGITSSIYAYETKKIGIISLALITILLALGINLTQSRTPWIAIPLVIAFLIYKKPDTRKIYATGGLCFFLTYTTLLLALPKLQDALLLQSSSALERAGNFQRILIWKQILYAIEHGPWYGYGWNQVSIAQNNWALKFNTGLPIEHSHNIFLDLIIWNGLPLGIVISTLILIGILFAMIKADSPNKTYATASILAIFAHSQLEFPVEYAYFLIPTGYLIGANFAGKSSLALRKTLFIPVYLISLALFTEIIIEYHKSEYELREIQFINSKASNKTSVEIDKKLILTNLYYLNTSLAAPSCTGISGICVENLILLKNVAARYPYGATNYRYLKSLELNRKIKELNIERKKFKSIYGHEPLTKP